MPTRELRDNWQPLVRARRATNIPQMLHCLQQARYRADDAAAIPWPALAASWRREANDIRELIRQRLDQTQGESA